MESELFNSLRVPKEIAETQSRDAVEFGERAEHEEVGICANEALGRCGFDKIDECLVDHDGCSSHQSGVGNLFNGLVRNQLAGNAVRIGEKHEIAIFFPRGEKGVRRK